MTPTSAQTDLAQRFFEIIESSNWTSGDDPVELSMAISLAMRATGLLALHRLENIAGEFPATIQTLLAGPTITEASVDSSEVLGFVDLVDLLSDKDLSCVAPNLHRGWQDKTQSCQNARTLVRRELNFSIDENMRGRLLHAAQANQRLFLLPDPAQLDLALLKPALLSLFDLATQLAGENGPAALISALKEKT